MLRHIQRTGTTLRTRGKDHASISPSDGYRSGTRVTALKFDAYPQNRQDVDIHVESSLVHPSGKRGIQALCQTFRDDQLVRDLLELQVRLECL